MNCPAPFPALLFFCSCLLLLRCKCDQQLVLSQALGPYFLQIHTFLLSGCSLQPVSCGLLKMQFPDQMDASCARFGPLFLALKPGMHRMTWMCRMKMLEA